MNRVKTVKLVVTGLLCAIGIVIPLFSPLKIILEPASFTLGSHIAIFIAMFISPVVAAAVAVGTTAGFLLAGFPLVVVLRAATHVVFAFLGALYLQRQPQVIDRISGTVIFSVVIAVIHGVCEMLVVIPFYFGQSMTAAYYSQGFVTAVVILVGVGSVVHSLIDFWGALLVWKKLRQIIRPLL